MKTVENYNDFFFASNAHKEAFSSVTREIGSTAPDIILTNYLLTATLETRRHFWSVVSPDGLVMNDRWETWEDEDSRRAMALLLNLTYHDRHGVLMPVCLFNSPLYPVLVAAIDYWHREAQDIA